MRFRIGQKVRVKKWLNMPENIQCGWGILTRCIGDTLVVVRTGESYENIPIYELQDSLTGELRIRVLEPEIESVIKVGEQLLFDFMNKE